MVTGKKKKSMEGIGVVDLLVLVASEGVWECVLAATSRADTVPPVSGAPQHSPQAGAQGCTAKLGDNRPSSHSGASHSPYRVRTSYFLGDKVPLL